VRNGKAQERNHPMRGRQLGGRGAACT
jgi:hypothetical protein